MGRRPAAEVRLLKEIEKQQRVVDNNDDPREGQQLDRLRRRLESERLAHPKPQPPPKPVSTTTPNPEASSASAKPTNREVRLVKAQTRVEQARISATEAQATTQRLRKEIEAASASGHGSTPATERLKRRALEAYNLAADKQQGLQAASEHLTITQESVRKAHDILRERQAQATKEDQQGQEVEAREATQDGVPQAQTDAQQKDAQIKADELVARQLWATEYQEWLRLFAQAAGLSIYYDDDCLEDEFLEHAVEDVIQGAVNDADEFAATLRKLQDDEEARPAPAYTDEPDQIDGFTELEGQPVAHAIAALMVGIFHQRGPQLGLASDAMQQMARYGTDNIQGFPCLTSPNKMVIPILLGAGLVPCGGEDFDGQVTSAKEIQAFEQTAEDEADNNPVLTGLGHWVLAIATREESNVGLQFMNSLPPLGPKTIIRRVARNIVRHCGWVMPGPVTFGEEEWSRVAVQQQGNTCGIHLVLNAWASILKLDLNTLGRSRQKAQAFYFEAKTVINRAMAGAITVEEIELWLYLTQYVKGSAADRAYQVAADEGLQSMIQARTARMNDERLRSYLEADEVAKACLDALNAPSASAAASPTFTSADAPSTSATAPSTSAAALSASPPPPVLEDSVRASPQPPSPRGSNQARTVTKPPPGFVNTPVFDGHVEPVSRTSSKRKAIEDPEDEAVQDARGCVGSSSEGRHP